MDISINAMMAGNEDIEAAKAALLEQTNGFCMLPWTHLHLRIEGKVAPCCDYEGELGDITQGDLRSILDGPKMRELRIKMLNGETVPGCWRCADRESSGELSIRRHMNRLLQDHIKSVLTTHPDGHAPDARQVYWDIRFSNICNFRCRTCWHGASSRWFEDAVRLRRQASDSALIRPYEDSDRLFSELEAFMPEVEEIYFAGGEPLIMDEHYRLLNTLIERGRTGVKLKYSSNLSTIAYKGRDVLTAWKLFPDVELLASVDALGARGELIRKDLNWDKFVRNLNEVGQRCPHVDRKTLTTVSIFNVLHLPDLQRFLHLHCGISLENIRLHTLQEPAFYSIRLLPRSLKDLARERLQAHLCWLGKQAKKDAAGVTFQQHQIDAVIQEIEGGNPRASLEEFLRESAKVDALRKESIEQVFPELAPIFTEST